MIYLTCQILGKKDYSDSEDNEDSLDPCHMDLDRMCISSAVAQKLRRWIGSKVKNTRFPYFGPDRFNVSFFVSRAASTSPVEFISLYWPSNRSGNGILLSRMRRGRQWRSVGHASSNCLIVFFFFTNFVFWLEVNSGTVCGVG